MAVARIWTKPPAIRQRAGALCAVVASLATASFAQSDPAALADQARQAMAERRFSEAADVYSELANSFPGEPSLQANLGMALHLSGRDEEALGPLRQAASAMPSSFQVHFFLGASLTRLGQYRESIEPLGHAARLDPSHAFAKALLGDSLEASGRFDAALEAWQALATLEPSNPYPRAGMARCYEQLALQALEELTRRDPESHYVLRLHGHSRLAAAQYPSALYLFRQALERKPDLRSAHEAIAEIYDQAGREEWAAVERERSTALPRVDCSSAQPAACAFAEGRFEEAARLPRDPSQEDLFWAARASARLAEREFSALVALDGSVDQLRLIADILASRQEFPKAVEAIRRSLELRPGDGSLERQLAELLYRARRIDEAPAFAGALSPLGPSRSEVAGDAWQPACGAAGIRISNPSPPVRSCTPRSDERHTKGSGPGPSGDWESEGGPVASAGGRRHGLGRQHSLPARAGLPAPGHERGSKGGASPRTGTWRLGRAKRSRPPRPWKSPPRSDAHLGT